MPAKSRICKTCPTAIRADNKSGQCIRCLSGQKVEVVFDSALTPTGLVQQDRDNRKSAQDLRSLRQKYDSSLKTIEKLEEDLRTVQHFGDSINTFAITPREGSGTGEATPVIVASDWHCEEVVRPEQVSGLNEHNLDISKARATRFFQSSLRLIRLLQQDVKINDVVLALLGDFLSNDIHEEFPENNALQPIHATLFAQELIASGIEFLLEHSRLNLTIPCHSGNHARTTRTVRVSSENGHSLEYFMYRSLAGYFRNEPRVKFIIPEGYHSYMDVYGHTLRFHHGHEINYQGGVGGIYIPVNKAIAQWNKARRADLDVFGHFHQARDGGNFICNGSSIGYNAYALSIKADFETPRQQLFLMDKKRGRTCTWPILLK